MRLASLVVTVGLVAATLASAQTPPDAVYRFYNRETGTHFYTISVSERDSVIQAFPQFAYEGATFSALAQARAGAVPVFRFYNTKTSTHFYTTSVSERDGIIAYYPQFAYENTAFYAMPDAGTDGRVGVFRFFNKVTGAHFYTASVTERDKVVASYPNFVYEGIAFYVYPTAAAASAPVVVRSSDAWRFLVQSSFAPTPATLARVSQLGVAGYLEDQFAQPVSGYPDSEYYYLSLDESKDCSFAASRSSAAYICARDQLTLFKFRNQFFVNAMSKPDQLRQRVAWALSQFFVISGMKDPDMEAAYVQARYHQMLFDEAFGNFGRLCGGSRSRRRWAITSTWWTTRKRIRPRAPSPTRTTRASSCSCSRSGPSSSTRTARRCSMPKASPSQATGRTKSRRSRAPSPAGRTHRTTRRRRKARATGATSRGRWWPWSRATTRAPRRC
jgi:hypothetical protein